MIHVPIDRYQVVGRVVHMDFVQEHLTTKKNVNFGNSQERPNNIELEVLADTIYVKVGNVILLLFQSPTSPPPPPPPQKKGKKINPKLSEAFKSFNLNNMKFIYTMNCGGAQSVFWLSMSKDPGSFTV